MAVRGLVLRVDGNCQRFDGVHVKIGDLFHIADPLGLRARNLTDPFFVESIEQVHQSDDQYAYEEERKAAAMDSGVQQGRRGNIRYLSDESPKQTFRRNRNPAFA